MFNKKVRRALVCALLGSVVSIATIGPASAHAVTVTDVSGSENPSFVAVDIMLSSDHHANGQVRVTLFKRNDSASQWVTVNSKLARWMDGAYGGMYYQSKFAVVPGDKQCKARVRFTAVNHDPSTKIDRFAC